MKKILFLFTIFALMGVNSYATKLYATYGTPAGNGSWDAETSTYTWTDGSNNLMDLFTFGSGELANYKSIHFTTSNYGGVAYRINFMQGSTSLAEIDFYSHGEKNIVFAERSETKDLDLSTITSIKFGGYWGASKETPGTITISAKPYLKKPMSLTWADDGTAEIDITDLTASGCFSINDQTGVLTSTYDAELSNWGRLAINFPDGGVDLTNLTGFSVSYTGDNLFGGFEINGGTNMAFYSNPTGRDDLNKFMTPGYVGDPTAITVWRWFNNETVGSMTLTSIKLKANVITANNPHETPLTSSMFVGGCENHIGGGVFGQGTTIYGNGSVLSDQYVDLSSYDEMRIYGTPNKTIRLLFNWGSGSQTEIAGADVKLNGDGYYSLDMSTVPAPKQLNAFKFPYDGKSGAINKVILYKNTVPVAYSYVVSGSGYLAPSATEALADATATSYDATGVTGTSVDLTSVANPNALFKANSGVLANTQNVIVSGTCANLELTDGYPFKAAEDFTATAASYTTTINETAKVGTLCLPFEATIPGGVDAYTLTYTSGAAATATPVETTIPANSPVLLNGSGSATFSGASVGIDADAANENGNMTGVFKNTSVPENSYVLQNGDSGVGFYRVTALDPITAAPFRAYLTAGGVDAHSIRIVYGGVTGTNNVNAAEVTAQKNGAFLENGKIAIYKNGMKFNAAGAKLY